jgi:hypothetical protein
MAQVGRERRQGLTPKRRVGERKDRSARGVLRKRSRKESLDLGLVVVSELELDVGEVLRSLVKE